jgi:hypothetical protein
MLCYAVCTRCAFLRAYSREAGPDAQPDSCPVCGGELIVRDRAERFPPTYVSRVSRELLQTPELEPEQRDA